MMECIRNNYGRTVNVRSMVIRSLFFIYLICPTAGSAFDLQSNTPSITCYHQSDGIVSGVTTNGSSVTAAVQFYQEANTAWTIVGQGDFDGDGIRDLVWWNNSTGQLYLMLMAGPTTMKSGAIAYTEPDTNWRVVTTGDIDGDGRSDLIWWNGTTGQVYAMLMNGTAATGGAIIYTEPNTAWKIVAAADFNGNGTVELLWWNTSTGQAALGQTSGTGASNASVIWTEPNTDWRIAGAGDLDADGRADIVWHNRKTGQVYGMQTNGSSVTNGAIMYTEPNMQWEIVSLGDYNDDGRADLLWWNQQTGQVYLMLMNGLSVAGGSLLYTEPDVTWKIQGETEWRDHVYGRGITTTTSVSSVSNTAAWTQTSFRSLAPSEPRHVNRVVVSPAGRIHAAWYTQSFLAYMSYSDDNGSTWKHNALERMTQIHQLIRMSDGTLVAGGESVATAPLLWYSRDDGTTWKSAAIGTSSTIGLPNVQSSIIWDLAERKGEVIITTSAETNAPTENHQVVYAWNPATNTLRALGALRGMGALAVAVKADGTIYVSTQDSAEHDDPATAGEGRVYLSTDGGVNWVQTGTLPSANRIYALTVLSDGSVVAGSGLNGGFYYSVNGNSWSLMSALPQGQRTPAPTYYSVTRVYRIIELASGALMVGTGNNAGDIFLTCDRGANWIGTAETGSNNVVWGLAQAPDGTIWIGNGSVQGDVWKAAPPASVSADQFYICSK